MTVNINWKAGSAAIWTSRPEDGQVVVMTGKSDVWYLTPEAARHLADDLRQAADKAESK